MQRQVFVALGLAAAAACAHSQVLLNQGFENVDALSNWVLLNNSSPAGAVSAAWFQGSADTFTAQSGTDASFIASSYNTAAAGGTLNNWLITPTFSTASAVDVVFYARADGVAGYSDQISFGWSNGSATPGSFTLSSPVTVGTSGWTQYTVHINAQGAGSLGRFAINYSGAADSANYVGIDSFSVTAVPEPSAALLMGAGLLGLVGWAGRRKQAR